MEMKRVRMIGVFMAVLALSYIAVREFMPEILALSWHVRHGRTAHLRSFNGGNYDVDVPMFSWVQADETGWALSVIKGTGRIRAAMHQPDWAMMSFSLVPSYSTAEELRAGAPLLRDKGLTITETAMIPVAGLDLYCFEQKWTIGKVAEMTRGRDVADLKCAPLPSPTNGHFRRRTWGAAV